MKRNIFAILLTGLCVLLGACGATPDKSGVPEAVTEDIAAATYDDGETVAEASETEPEVVETAAETDFGALAGTWYADEGGAVLTIYGNGGFELNETADTYEGYLVYTDADGGMWETGPRYELYLENNERLPECFFALDDAQPGKLVYAVGGGAELFSRGDSAYDDNGVTVRVRWADDSLTDADEFVAHSGEYEVGIVFTAERTLQNFKVLSISLEGVDDDGMPVFSVLELYSQDTLTPERPLLVRTSFPGDMPSNGISYTDDTGTTRYFSVSESGFNSSLILSEFTRG